MNWNKFGKKLLFSFLSVSQPGHEKEPQFTSPGEQGGKAIESPLAPPSSTSLEQYITPGLCQGELTPKQHYQRMLEQKIPPERAREVSGYNPE
jgi:hypothetical protein